MKKSYKIILAFLSVFLMFYSVVLADETVKVMEVQDQGDFPSVFVKGIEGEVQNVEALIGNNNCEQVAVHPISSEAVSMKTLILVDNSLSIPEKNRSTVKDIISEMFASRSNNEQFALATFGEDIEMLIDFTNDYGQLKNAVAGIEFHDRETYLTDVLYDLIQNRDFGQDDEKIYKRIFIISDGVDNKSLGYTKEELADVLKNTSIPLYTLGVYNSKKSNTEELSNMFALSRQTQADSFLLNDLENPMSVVDAMALDQGIVRFDIVPPLDIRDGSQKTVTLHIQYSGTEKELKIDSVRMPQEAVQQISKEEPEEEPEDLIETPDLPEQERGMNQATLIIIILVCVISVLVLGVVLFLVISVLKKKKKENELNEIEDPFSGYQQEDATEMLSGGYGGSDGDTVQIFGNNLGKNPIVTLTDIASPMRSYQKTIMSRLVIGRSATNADICIDYDKSISSRHCAIEKRGNSFYLIDLQSSNGTYLDGSKVLSEIEIFSGCVLKLGRVEFRVEIG